MVGTLLDTNVYGEIVEDKENTEKIVEAIKRDSNFIIHNFKVIRDELRKMNKILPLYDALTTNRIIMIESSIEKVAELYFKEYKKIGGIQKKTPNFMNDLRIVACASIKNFNIIYSNDKRTMQQDKTINAYKKINLIFNYRTPTFYSYKDLKWKFLNKF